MRPKVLRVFALVLAAALAVGACGKQGEGEVCETVNANEDCESGLECVAAESLLDSSADRCCPPEGEAISSSSCRPGGRSTPGGTGGASGTGGSPGAAGSAGAAGTAPLPGGAAGAAGSPGPTSGGGSAGAGAAAAGAAGQPAAGNAAFAGGEA